MIARVKKFLGEVRTELGKASWPWDPKEKGFKRYRELYDSTVVVIIGMIFLGAFVSLTDLVLASVSGVLTKTGYESRIEKAAESAARAAANGEAKAPAEALASPAATAAPSAPTPAEATAPAPAAPPAATPASTPSASPAPKASPAASPAANPASTGQAPPLGS